MQTSFQIAYILHRQPYRDTSLLLEVFTKEGNRIGLIARGARRPRSPFRGLMEPFQPLAISWVGKGDLGTLVTAEASGIPLRLTGKNLIPGFYLSELLLRLVQRHDAHLGLYEEYENTLQQLATLNSDDNLATERLLRLFEKHLLESMGYALSLHYDAQTEQPLESDKFYCYDIERGPVEKQSTHPPRHGIEMSGAHLIALRDNTLNSIESLRDAKRLMRAILAVHLNGRPLQSRQIMADVEHSLRMQREQE